MRYTLIAFKDQGLNLLLIEEINNSSYCVLNEYFMPEEYKGTIRKSYSLSSQTARLIGYSLEGQELGTIDDISTGFCEASEE